MHRASYQLVEDGTFYGEITECQGVWANARSLEISTEELQPALED